MKIKITNFPKDTSEHLIQTELNKLIKKVTAMVYTKDAQEGGRMLTPEKQLETLGIILSKYCEWVGEDIKTVALSAFEDANFHHAEIIL